MRENRRLDGLLAEFRSLTKRQLLNRAPTDIASMIEHVLAVQSPVLTGAGIVARMELEPQLPVLDVDDGKLTQVLLNLTKNAVEAMGSEGGSLVGSSLKREHLRCDRGSDSGRGVPVDLDIFAPFKTTKQAGTGLGLAVARQIAKHTAEHWSTSRAAPGPPFAWFSRASLRRTATSEYGGASRKTCGERRLRADPSGDAAEPVPYLGGCCRTQSWRRSCFAPRTHAGARHRH